MAVSCKREERPDTSADEVSFTDSLGREVTVKKNPKRVAALLGSFADVWQLSGGNLCASSDDAWDDFGLDMENAVNLGGTKSPSLELLFSSDPDFVIASSSTAANVKMKDSLEQAGITVAYFDVSTFDDYLHLLDVCTDITGRKDLYEKNGLAQQSKLEELKKSFENDPLDADKKTVLFLRASSGYIRAKNSEGSVLGEMLKDLGCINIADSDDSLLENLSIESIIKADPYRIFIVQVGDDKEAVAAGINKMLESNPAWNELDAIKNDRVHYMDKTLFNLKPNARWYEAYEQLADILRS